MALQMKALCERCREPLAGDAIAYICAFECTFCANCSNEMRFTCVNCGGELVRRPRRMPGEAPGP